MNFSDLKNFLLSKMRLSHIYQPLLIKTLVEAGGSATIRQLAISFLSSDESQILYYEKRLKEMPIKILSKHGVINKDDGYSVEGFTILPSRQSGFIRRRVVTTYNGITVKSLQRFTAEADFSVSLH